MKWFGFAVIVGGVLLTIFNSLQVKYLIENQDELIQSANLTGNQWMLQSLQHSALLFVGLLMIFGGWKLLTRKQRGQT